ncbi:MAG: prepilin-type N-terminal cleavage/methylation domain-containing protein [Calditrichaeota bacterium]|nr:prepilin-type N-terminal cleavage/methylation domain-containing protein [Calditrichota bacterium]
MDDGSTRHVIFNSLLANRENVSVKTTGKQSDGFTFIEVVVVITILGILAAVAIVTLSTSSSDFQLNAAARKIISDVQYAQDLSMTTGNRVQVKFEIANNRYSLLWADDSPVPNIMGSGNFVVSLGSGAFRNVEITDTELTGGILKFDTIGEPFSNAALIFSATLIVELNHQKQIYITPYTGKLYIQ